VNEIHIVDTRMRPLRSVALAHDIEGIFRRQDSTLSSVFATRGSFYLSEHICSIDQHRAAADLAPTLYRLEHEAFAVRTQFSSPEHSHFSNMTMASGNTLFVMATCRADGLACNEILTFDALTLEHRNSFGRASFPSARKRYMAVIQAELFVTNEEYERLQVFSLDGERLRTVRGDWITPGPMCAVKDRLFLIEGSTGRRIFVLAQEGNEVQVCAPPLPSGCEMRGIVHFQRSLLIWYVDTHVDTRSILDRIFALHGHAEGANWF